MTLLEPLVIPEVRLDDIVTIMDVMGDVNPIHVDTELVAALGLRGPVNQGPANMAYVMNMLIRWAGSPEAIEHIHIRFKSISCPGDRLEARGRVVSLTDRPEGPLAHCDVELVLEDGTRVLSGSADVAAPDGFVLAHE